MPLDPSRHAVASARYAAANARYAPRDLMQRELDAIARSQQQKTPRQCNAIALLYFSALVLPSICVVNSSAKQLNRLAGSATRPDSCLADSLAEPLCNAL